MSLTRMKVISLLSASVALAAFSTPQSAGANLRVSTAASLGACDTYDPNSDCWDEAAQKWCYDHCHGWTCD
jgi:hypothetical protein